jgi:succinate dehydrogenase hydrophobic anchor subunit
MPPRSKHVDESVRANRFDGDVSHSHTWWRQAVSAVQMVASLGEHFRKAYEDGTDAETRAVNVRRTRLLTCVFLAWCGAVAGLEVRREVSRRSLAT